jgi:phosphoglycolate phosphatase-like HAD superfamily hydrolase
MKRNPIHLNLIIILVLMALGALTAVRADGLPSWNEGPSRAAIVDFVADVTDAGGSNFVPPSERVAVFDNDGTLWAEQPLYFQAIYIFDRIKSLAPEHPEWKTEEPFTSVLKGDHKAALAGGGEALLKMAAATHAGITAEEFNQSVRTWISTARHPKTNRPYNEMVYQPMLEALNYLRANDFKTFIVSGGGIDFMRVFAEETYGIPPEQIIGSSIKAGYEIRDGKPTIVKLPELNFIDDKAGKPVGIHQHIGRRPIAAFGNSDGDFEMLEWTTAGKSPRLGVIIHHTDADREWAYDRDSHIGRLDKALDGASQRGWVVVNMKSDWSRIYPEGE